jgi:hypothetical protein
MNEKVIDFTIGADPEFACLKARGGVVAANDFINDDEDSEFGCDGNGITFEIRPAPSKDPIEVVNNIHDIFVRQTIKDPQFLKFRWLAGTWHNGYPFGGHVHFGIPSRLIAHKDAVDFLDHYVGVVSLLMEIKRHGVKRRDDGYGHMGDMRVQPWGFEYRPMSSWVSSPYVSAAMLCLSKTVMYEVLNNSKFQWHKFAINSDFDKMDQRRILEQFPKIWADITKMHLYQLYKPYIDLIYFLVKNKLTWLPASGMKESWGVVDMQPCIANKIGMDVIWHRYNLEQIPQQ